MRAEHPSVERGMITMTHLREQAIEIIKEIPEEKIIYVVNILKNVRDLSDYPQKRGGQENDKKVLLEQLEKYRGRLPKDFDYKKELEEARNEKYADFHHSPIPAISPDKLIENYIRE